MATTVRRVVRPRGTLTKDQAASIGFARKGLDQAEARYRRMVLLAIAEGASYSEVSKATGLSTSTLQRWKREVGK